MENNHHANELIELSLPINAAYVSAARLTASSIANRMAFDIDEIEDIKAAVSEACTFIVKNIAQGAQGEFKIAFHVASGVLTTMINTDLKFSRLDETDEMGLLVIRALMDSFTISEPEVESFQIVMVKKHKNISFN